MFKIQLGTGVEFDADSVEQNSTADITGRPSVSFMMEKTPADHTLSWYIEQLNEPGALDSIVVKNDKGDELIPGEKWDRVSNISIRLLGTGDRSMSISLSKSLT